MLTTKLASSSSAMTIHAARARVSHRWGIHAGDVRELSATDFVPVSAFLCAPPMTLVHSATDHRCFVYTL